MSSSGQRRGYANRGGGSRGRGRGRGRGCHTCGNFGHLQAKCPYGNATGTIPSGSAFGGSVGTPSFPHTNGPTAPTGHGQRSHTNQDNRGGYRGAHGRGRGCGGIKIEIPPLRPGDPAPTEHWPEGDQVAIEYPGIGNFEHGTATLHSAVFRDTACFNDNLSHLDPNAGIHEDPKVEDTLKPGPLRRSYGSQHINGRDGSDALLSTQSLPTATIDDNASRPSTSVADLPATSLSSANGRSLVLTNHLQVTNIPETVYQYEIKRVQPVERNDDGQHLEAKSRAERRRISRALAEDTERSKKVFQDITWATDCNHIWALQKLDCFRFPELAKLQYYNRSGGIAQIHDFVIEAYLSNPITIGKPEHSIDLINAVPTDDSQRNIRIINAFVMKFVNTKSEQLLQQGANKFFLPPTRKDIGEGLVAIRGYYASVKAGTSNMLLNVNTTTSAFYNVPQLVSHYVLRNNCRYGSVQSDLKGLQVRATYGTSTPAERERAFNEFSYNKENGKSVWLNPQLQEYWENSSGTGTINRTQGHFIAKINQDLNRSHPTSRPVHVTKETWLPCVDVGKRFYPPRSKAKQLEKAEMFLPEHLEIRMGQQYTKSKSNKE